MARPENHEDQLNLIDLLEPGDVEHIDGSMPADEADKQRARQDYYDRLPQSVPKGWDRRAQ